VRHAGHDGAEPVLFRAETADNYQRARGTA